MVTVCLTIFFVFFCPQGESRTRQASTEQSIREHNGHGGYVASRTRHGGSVTPLLLFFFRCYASFVSRESKWWRNERGKAGFPW